MRACSWLWMWWCLYLMYTGIEDITDFWKHECDHIKCYKRVERFSLDFFFRPCLWTDLCLCMLTDSNHIVFSFKILDYHQFYLALDNEFLADRIKSLVGFLGANWRRLGRPILTMIITHSMLGMLSWQLIWHLSHTLFVINKWYNV